MNFAREHLTLLTLLIAVSGNALALPITADVAENNRTTARDKSDNAQPHGSHSRQNYPDYYSHSARSLQREPERRADSINGTVNRALHKTLNNNSTNSVDSASQQEIAKTDMQEVSAKTVTMAGSSKFVFNEFPLVDHFLKQSSQSRRSSSAYKLLQSSSLTEGNIAFSAEKARQKNSSQRLHTHRQSSFGLESQRPWSPRKSDALPAPEARVTQQWSPVQNDLVFIILNTLLNYLTSSISLLIISLCAFFFIFSSGRS